MPRFRVELTTLATTAYEVTADNQRDALILARRFDKDGPLGIHLRIVRLGTTYTDRTETAMIPTPGAGGRPSTIDQRDSTARFAEDDGYEPTPVEPGEPCGHEFALGNERCILCGELFDYTEMNNWLARERALEEED